MATSKSTCLSFTKSFLFPTITTFTFGAFSLSNLAIDMYPEMDLPAISVITTYPGANASDIETNVTRVLEDNLNTVENLKEITSRSEDNFSMISLTT